MKNLKLLPSAVGVFFVAFGLLVAGSGNAADVAMVSGLFKNESAKIDGTNAGGKTEISAGARYHEDMGSNMAWFGHGGLSLKSYKAPSGGESPDNSTGIALGGGVRWYFSPFSTSAVPFAAAMGSYENDKDVDYQGSSGGFDETESSGLFYAGSGGVRIGMDSRFWVELETMIFKSALYATEKRQGYSVVNGQFQAGTKTQTTKTELFAESYAPLTSTLVSFGMKL